MNTAHPVDPMLLLPRLSKQVFRRSTPDVIDVDLRRLVALSYLRDHLNAPQQDLADALCMDASNVVLLLNELEDAGCATRRRDPADRRRHRVDITEAGRAALERGEAAQQAFAEELFGGLEPEERATFWALVAKVVARAEPGQPAAAADQPAAATA